ncbi:hypothetical protein [uncultured Nevskia sp.]|uniref:hypothetical protein n=1 Tax=uncultured Nevskia sp. TaxID=228950 RepID=UPI0025CCED4C|nr:hypothetical protein [uncultured Nevskia sp.]
MSSAPNTPPEDDVQRLLKQMNMAAFRFKSFDRTDNHEDGAAYDAAAPVEAAEVVEAPVAPRQPPVPPPPLVAAAPAKAARPTVTQQQVRDAAPVDEAFGRLIRQTEPRAKRAPMLRLDLPVLPRIAELTPVASGELMLTDVLNRLYRLGASKVSLIRQRGDA